VRVLDDSLHEHFRVEHLILFGYHAPRDRKETTEEGKVEKDGTVRSDLEVDEKVRVDDGGEKKDGSKGASNERGKSGLVRQLTYQNNTTESHFMMIASFSLGN
jgi:hypothetical protein